MACRPVRAERLPEHPLEPAILPPASPGWSLIEVCFLWLSIVSLIIFTARHSRLAGILLTPYLIWVSLASVLHFDVVRPNGQFG